MNIWRWHKVTRIQQNPPLFRLLHRVDILDHETLDVYLTRWEIIRTPWFGINVHRIRRPDWARHCHDHPWPFFAFIVKGGGYVQEVQRPQANGVTVVELQRVELINNFPKGQYHKIIKILDGPAWSLVFRGRERSGWGFLVDSNHVPSAEYLAS